MESLKQWPSLVWIDLEMSGLALQHDRILEIACIITDSDLNIIAVKEPIIIHQERELLEGMDDWNTTQHNKTGLVEAVKESKYTTEQAEHEMLAFIKEYCEPQTAPLCGNSIWVDRLFLKTYMPVLEQYLYYRTIDVSTVKQLVNFWYGKPDKEFFTKKDTHRALDDIRESIEELKYYRENFFRRIESHEE